MRQLTIAERLAAAALLPLAAMLAAWSVAALLPALIGEIPALYAEFAVWLAAANSA